MAASSDDRGNERTGGGDAEQEERTDGWMATYADMVTLLLTFFVLMFALSNVDNEKAEMFLFAMSRGGITAEQFMEIQQRYSLDDLESGEWDDDMFPTPPHDEDEDGGEGEEGETEGERALRELAEAIRGYVDARGLAEVIGISFNGDFLMLTLTNDIWFESGSAEISPEMRENGIMIAELLAYNFTPDDPFEIIVAGHTDNIPMNTAQFPSNWHLGNGRATSFLELLINESGLNPWYFHTRSGGEFRPIATNDTPEGRQANRRVEVMISRAQENPLWNEMSAELFYDPPNVPAVEPADEPDDDPGDDPIDDD